MIRPDVGGAFLGSTPEPLHPITLSPSSSIPHVISGRCEDGTVGFSTVLTEPDPAPTRTLRLIARGRTDDLPTSDPPAREPCSGKERG